MFLPESARPVAKVEKPVDKTLNVVIVIIR